MKNKYFDELKEAAGLEEEEEIPEENLVPVSPEEGQLTVRRTVRTVFFIMGILTLLEALAVLFLADGPVTDWEHGKWQDFAGLFLGAAVGAVWFWTMKIQIEQTAELPENQAKWKIRLGAVLRYLVLAGLIVGAWLTGFANPILIFIGVFNLKLAIYLSGLFNKKHSERSGSAV
ncbi:MAG: hypothetical protein J5794_06005 [Lachnospiraceae bacterium]|nr:hypothetical protein [Lachnospiraceae bacterium]